MARGFTPEQLAQIDWHKISQPDNHPLKVVVTPQEVRELESNSVIATVAPGYRFFWAHDHVHIAPVDWDHRAAEDELTAPVATQVAKPLMGGALASLAMTLAAASSKQGAL